MRNADPRAYGGGIWPLQHSGYKDRGYKLITRSSMLAYRIKDRLTGVGDVGQWKYEEDSCGDVVGGNLWGVNAGKREGLAAWAFAWPTLMQTAASGGEADRPDVATGTDNAATPNRPRARGRNFAQKAAPVREGDMVDDRFEPKGVTVPLPDGAPSDDPNAGGGAGGGAGAGAGAGAGGRNGQRETLTLGIGGWVWPTTGGRFPSFGGVRTDYSNHSPAAGARFNDPADPYRAPNSRYR